MYIFGLLFELFSWFEGDILFWNGQIRWMAQIRYFCFVFGIWPTHKLSSKLECDLTILNLLLVLSIMFSPIRKPSAGEFSFTSPRTVRSMICVRLPQFGKVWRFVILKISIFWPKNVLKISKNDKISDRSRPQFFWTPCTSDSLLTLGHWIFNFGACLRCFKFSFLTSTFLLSISGLASIIELCFCKNRLQPDLVKAWPCKDCILPIVFLPFGFLKILGLLQGWFCENVAGTAENEIMSPEKTFWP